MRMLRFMIALLSIVIASQISHAQEHIYSVLEMKFMTEEPSMLEESYVKTDAEGDTLSVVKVKTVLDNLTFVGNVFGQPNKVATSDGYNYYVYITEGSRSLTIRHDLYHQVSVKFPKTIAQKELWEIEVTGIEVQQGDIIQTSDDDNKYSVNIDTEDFTQLYIDEELYRNKKGIQLAEGTHYVTVKYANDAYSKKVNIKENEQYVDANLGGLVTIKNADSVNIQSLNGPAPNLYDSEKKNTYEYNGMLGRYKLFGKAKLILINDEVEKEITVNSRTTTVLRLDEMVHYVFVMYHGSHLQPIGFNIGGCRNWGWFISYNQDIHDKMDTPYGETEFKGGDDKSSTFRSAAMTFSAGPMVRLWHKLYMQAGVGWIYYLRTSEPKMLTADYKYKSSVSLNAELLYRRKQLVVGAGYVRQFVKNAYNPGISNQFSFSVGFCM